MRINFYSSFREHAGVKNADLTLPPQATVKDVIGVVLQEFPALRRLWLDDKGELHAHVHISLNQVDVMALPDKLESRVEGKSVLDFYPPITGG